MPPAGAAPAAAGPRVRSFECDVTADVLWRSLVADVDSPRPIVLSHPLSRRDPETPVHTDSVHKCNSENINVPL